MMEIMTNMDPVVLLCDKHILQTVLNDSSPRVVGMEDMLCHTNWTKFSYELMGMFDSSTMTQQVSLYFESRTL